MKVAKLIAKIVVALAAIAGAVYVIATYGNQIVAWCKKVLASLPCCDGECECCECQGGDADLSVRTMFLMAVATSIDALAVGISLAMAGNVDIFSAVILIGLFTCGMSTMGVKIGNVFGSRFEKKAQLAGGVILVLLGLKILLEHLGILA